MPFDPNLAKQDAKRAIATYGGGWLVSLLIIFFGFWVAHLEAMLLFGILIVFIGMGGVKMTGDTFASAVVELLKLKLRKESGDSNQGS